MARKRTDPETGEEVSIQKLIRDYWEKKVAEFGFRNEKGELVWDDRIVSHLGEIGAMTLSYLAEVEGDREAAKFLVEKCFGLPEQPFSVRVQTLPLEQARKYLYTELRKQGYTDTTALAMSGLEALPTVAAPGSENDPVLRGESVDGEA